MPYRITWLEQTVIIDFLGRVTTQEIREHSRKVNEDPRFPTVKKRISNCLKAESVEAGLMDVKIFGFIDKEVSHHTPNAPPGCCYP